MEKNLKNQRGGIQLIVFIGVILILTIVLFVIVLFTRNNNNENSSTTNNSSAPSTIATSNETSTGDLKVDMTEQAKKAFNAKFESYEGSEISSVQVKTLKNMIEANNASDTEFKVEFISGEIKEDSKYTVTLSYGDNGFVNKVEVK